MGSRRGLGRVALCVIAAAAVAFALLRPSSGADAGWPIADPARAGAPGELWGEAVVLVDSRADGAGDFNDLVVPYLQQFGVPFGVLDLATSPPLAGIDRYSLIVLGHRGVAAELDDAARATLADAVEAGAGLLSFAGDPWPVATPDAPPVPSSREAMAAADVTFADPSAERIVELSDDAHQEPKLPTLDPDAKVVTEDGRWTERRWPAIGTATVLAGIEQGAGHGRSPMRFAANDVPPGDYDVVAELYTGPPRTDLRYFFGFSGEAPDARHVDAVGGSGGTREHTEYWLGQVAIGDGGFALQVQRAEVLSGPATFFGWSRVRLVRAPAAGDVAHYIAGRHRSWERLPTGPMRLAQLASSGAEVVAYAGGAPLAAVRGHGRGRIVAWSTTDWMRHSVRGPLGGLDDVLWRSIVWAARKPLVLQVLPPLLTMRVDDESGPLDWLHTAIAVGFKPWVGVFLSNVDDGESRELAAVVRRGDATASVHSFDDPTFFYFDHFGRRAWPAATMAANWRRAVEWHARYDLPMSKYVVPHFYEIGANALPLVTASGAEFIATHMTPGSPYGTPWLRSRPFRRESRGVSTANETVYYADFLPGPEGSPEARLFNCVTEIRDDAGYEWYPSPQVDVTVGRAVRQLSRAFDSRTLATLFTHGYFFPPIPPADWRTILERTLAAVAVYEPIQMTMDEACGFVRDQQTSELSAVRIAADGAVHVTLRGRAVGATTVSVFTGRDGSIVEQRVAVPAFAGSVDVTVERADAAGAASMPPNQGLR